MSELLPCPFCGGEAHLVTGAPEYWVKCLSCNASSDTTACSVRAADQWNWRHIPDGWQAVPNEPTDEMLRYGGSNSNSEQRQCWYGMLAVAPKPPC